MITILLSHERSGSHLVSSYIREQTENFVFDEVCYIFSVSAENKASFHRFQVAFIDQNKDLYLSSKYSKRLDFTKSYFDHLLNISKSDKICVDIKYGHLHNFDWFWNPIFRRPLLLELSEQQGYKLIHLYRQNVVEASVSAILADKRNVWHSWQTDNAEKVNGFTVGVDVPANAVFTDTVYTDADVDARLDSDLAGDGQILSWDDTNSKYVWINSPIFTETVTSLTVNANILTYTKTANGSQN